MNGSQGAKRRCSDFFGRVCLAGDCRAAIPVLLVPFSIRVPSEVLDPLLVAAPQLRPRQGDIAAVAIDRFPSERGY
ncbi:MAG: hypothetical protein M3546_04400 [Actinomycetota bacterium]|nr:hypothetical protein [Actinomycetota bacterium]